MNTRRLSTIPAIVLLATALGASSIFATSYISVEPIPNEEVVGVATVQTLRGAGYTNLETWAGRLKDCGIVQDVIDALDDDEAIPTVTSTNTNFRVAAGGFEGVTNPSYVFTVLDAVSTADVAMLSNTLGYVLNQGSTAHFSPNNFKAYVFALDYAVVTLPSPLDGLEAKAFFEHVGSVDLALFSGLFAGFTQIDFPGPSTNNNSMLFLKPATSKHQFIAGLSTATSTFPGGADYSTLKNNGEPTTARAGIDFPENDWATATGGQQYLARLGERSPLFLGEIEAQRQRHITAVRSLEAAINAGNVVNYLANFTCPALPAR